MKIVVSCDSTYLKLYIDLSEGFTANKQYNITHNNVDVKSVSIDPKYIKSK